MRTDPSVAATLREVGFDVLSMAGNHALDFGAEAAVDTVTALRAAGIGACGVGESLAEARAPAIIEARGRRRRPVVLLDSSRPAMSRSVRA